MTLFWTRPYFLSCQLLWRAVSPSLPSNAFCLKVSIGENVSADETGFKWFHSKGFLFRYSDTLVREIRLGEEKAVGENSVKQMSTQRTENMKNVLTRSSRLWKSADSYCSRITKCYAIRNLKDLLVWTPHFDVSQDNQITNSSRIQLFGDISYIWLSSGHFTVKCYV